MADKPTYEELAQRVLELEETETELKQLRKKLQEPEERLKALSEASFEAIFFSEKGICLDQNRTAERMFGYTRAEAIGRRGTDWIVPKDHEQVRINMASGHEKPYEVTALKKDGDTFPCEIQARMTEYQGRSIRITALRDISDRKRAEESLRESHKRYQLIVENISNVVWTMDMNFHNTFVSPSVYQQRGYTPEEVKNQPLSERMTPNSIQKVLDLYKEKLKLIEAGDPGGWEPAEFEIEQPCKDGSTIWTTNTVRFLPGPDKQPANLLGTTHDITERKRTEEALLKQSYFLQKAQEIGQIGTWELNIKKNELLWTDENYRIFGIPIGTKLTYETFLNCVHPDDREYVDKEWKAAFHKKPYDIEHRLLVDGKVKWVREKAELQFNEMDECILGTGFTQDITDLKCAEKALRDVKKRNQALLDHSPVSHKIVDLDFNLIYMSKNGYNMLQLDENADFYGKPYPFEFFPEAFRNEMTEDLERVKETGDTITLEAWADDIKGNKVWLHSTLLPVFDDNGKIEFITVVSADITQRKRAEKEKAHLEGQLNQARKMEAIGTLAGGIAHDFNNILAVILGNAELASDDVPDSNPASKSLKEIRKASIRAKDMVRQLLAFSRKTDEKNGPLDMVPTIKESMEMLRSAVPASVEFKQHISDDPCNILGDATQINQIVMNLVINAADAMTEEGGLLEVTLEKIIVKEEESCFDWVLSPGAYVRLTISDTGEGIGSKILNRIFDPYFTTKGVGKGTGMGLSVVHGIVKRHGGGIRVESELGKGTLFHVYFPLLKGKVEEEKRSESKIKKGSERILFVDDEESVVNLNRQRLERLGYQVRSTRKPEEALEWFRADPDGFDVIITDLTMPRMTGDRLATEILAIRPKIPVIICTGYSERMSEAGAMALGACKYMEKPIENRNLAAALREVLEGK